MYKPFSQVNWVLGACRNEALGVYGGWAKIAHYRKYEAVNNLHIQWQEKRYINSVIWLRMEKHTALKMNTLETHIKMEKSRKHNIKQKR